MIRRFRFNLKTILRSAITNALKAILLDLPAIKLTLHKHN